MKRLLGERSKIKASGGVRTIGEVLELRDAGCTANRHHRYRGDSRGLESQTRGYSKSPGTEP